MTATETQVDTDSGYYELFIPLWDGDSRPVHGTIGVYGDEDALRDVSPGLVDSIHDYCGETEPSNPLDLEHYFGENVEQLYERGLLRYGYCHHFGIDSTDELIATLQDEDSPVELFPVR
jgi:hypothetical protein